jgi:signal transduction histidine kinase
MRERAARLNARFEIKSSAQQGTIVSIEVEIDPLTR